MTTDDEASGTKKRSPEESGLGEPLEPKDPGGLEEPADEVEYIHVEQEESPAGEPAAKPHGAADRRLKARLKQREAELKTVKAERDDLRDKYLRTLAEMENLRKRFDRDRQDYIQYALSDFLKELLGVLDNFERALENRDGAEGRSFFEGVAMIHRQYLDLLNKRGVRPVEPKDKSFDPAVQQAVLTEESEAVAEPEVAEELQRGYLLNDRLLRPALVKVLVPKKGGPE